MIVDKIKKRDFIEKNKYSHIDIPVGKWIKCEKCKEIIYKETLRNNLSICPNCGYYFRMHINRRIELILDKASYENFDLNIETNNPLAVSYKHLDVYKRQVWYTNEKNNIAFSFFIKMDCKVEKIQGITIQIAETILEILKKDYQILLEIKPPNDIFYHHKKIGGILTQSKIFSGRVKALVVGIGLNTSQEV